ncbi:sigma-70 family RNA polymerase sigma factor [Dysosmobacter welbionis]|uniref:sigma-70 family RNA polymerase sigma factor n=1 Tax=Dysosmobacter welbionis TaxID=2093857 RepID=UPI002941E996|nr:sigma-70 family RNA polymerase sigma factor [Dysosmobacter welbionis]
MLDRNKYFPNYQKIYPELIDRPDILKFLNQSDQKIKYMEVDLKQNEFIQDLDKKVAILLPSKEDSLERLQEEEHCQFPDEQDIEAQMLTLEEIDRLYVFIAGLEKDEQELLFLRYWKELTQTEVAKYFSVSQPTICYREKRILQKLKRLMEE